MKACQFVISKSRSFFFGSGNSWHSGIRSGHDFEYWNITYYILYIQMCNAHNEFEAQLTRVTRVRERSYIAIMVFSCLWLVWIC